MAEKTIRAISTSQRVDNSWAFLKSPLLLFEKVTCLAAKFSIFLIWVFCLTILIYLVLKIRKIIIKPRNTQNWTTKNKSERILFGEVKKNWECNKLTLTSFAHIKRRNHAPCLKKKRKGIYSMLDKWSSNSIYNFVLSTLYISAHIYIFFILP